MNKFKMNNPQEYAKVPAWIIRLWKNFFSQLKQEIYHGREYHSFEELKQTIDDCNYYYNHERMKEKLNWLSPVQYREAALKAA